MQKIILLFINPKIQYLEAGGGRSVRLETRQRRTRRREFRMQHSARARIVNQIHVASGLCVGWGGWSGGGGQKTQTHAYISFVAIYVSADQNAKDQIGGMRAGLMRSPRFKEKRKHTHTHVQTIQIISKTINAKSCTRNYQNADGIDGGGERGRINIERQSAIDRRRTTRDRRTTQGGHCTKGSDSQMESIGGITGVENTRFSCFLETNSRHVSDTRAELVSVW